MKELPFVPYNQNLIGYARENRKQQTKAEGLFWNIVLKGKNILGYKFRRQKVIGSFILDFYCSKLSLGIEIDGGYHTQAEQHQYDQERQDIIRHYGVDIIRFTNEEIERNLKEVVISLEKYVSKREQELKIIRK